MFLCLYQWLGDYPRLRSRGFIRFPYRIFNTFFNHIEVLLCTLQPKSCGCCVESQKVYINKSWFIIIEFNKQFWVWVLKNKFNNNHQMYAESLHILPYYNATNTNIANRLKALPHFRYFPAHPGDGAKWSLDKFLPITRLRLIALGLGTWHLLWLSWPLYARTFRSPPLIR